MPTVVPKGVSASVAARSSGPAAASGAGAGGNAAGSSGQVPAESDQMHQGGPAAATSGREWLVKTVLRECEACPEFDPSLYDSEFIADFLASEECPERTLAGGTTVPVPKGAQGPVAASGAEFDNLVQVIRNECKVFPRQLLSAHTTASCRIKAHKEKSPCVSLHACGIDTVVNVEICISLPHSFISGDGMPLVYRQPVAGRTKKAIKEAQGEACTQILAVLLARDPQAVILAHGALRHGADSAKAIRAAAKDCQTAGGAAEPGAMVAPSSNNAIAEATQLALERSSGSVTRNAWRLCGAVCGQEYGIARTDCLVCGVPWPRTFPRPRFGSSRHAILMCLRLSRGTFALFRSRQPMVSVWRRRRAWHRRGRQRQGSQRRRRQWRWR